MKSIKEVIVVEGKNDSNRLKCFFDCDTIETNGSALNKQCINLIKEVNENRGCIIFTDPDSSGNRLRSKLNEAIPNLKNAFLLREQCDTGKKVGIEHAQENDLVLALENLVTYGSSKQSLSYDEFLSLGLNGSKDAKEKRDKLAKAFSIGQCNSKTCFKRLNLLGKSKDDCLEILNDSFN